MCIISAAVEKVAATKIFCSALQGGERQILVYSNAVETFIPNNTMILPVPNPESVHLLNLKEYSTFFEDCARSFIKPSDHSHHLYASRSFSAGIHDSYDPLPVHSVGSYSASIVPSIPDFDRLDRQSFVILPALVKVLEEKYDDSFGFIVCRLKRGHHAYHPFAYTHAIHHSKLLFVPTYHIHPHLGKIEKEVRGDWDHCIYTAGTDIGDGDDGTSYRYTKWKFAWNRLPSDLRWIEKIDGKRYRRKGYKENKDMWLRNLYSATKSFEVPEHMRYREGDEYNRDFPIEGPGGLRSLRKYFRGEL